MNDAGSSPGEPAPRVLIADDQTLVRTGFRMILRDAGIPVVGEAVDGTQAVAAALEHHPDVVLMDIRMPEMDGLEAPWASFPTRSPLATAWRSATPKNWQPCSLVTQPHPGAPLPRR